ncbi:hypothetical protein M0R04_12875 [Candidatus Dojkabacteria bacterium]|jgi:hypothetical protein|nr:hypothetical protein [Candidatus Dojkabacteria bacterium]
MQCQLCVAEVKIYFKAGKLVVCSQCKEELDKLVKKFERRKADANRTMLSYLPKNEGHARR